LNARGYFLEVEHPIIGKAKIPGFPFKLSETPGNIERPSPLVGEHNEEVFRKYLGLGKEEIEKLKNEGAI
jgi:crotonobetainyl-CoA:carnitine CoA-transferase CaiB-like acyl-CoA transferase